jgi:hypothetical protein
MASSGIVSPLDQCREDSPNALASAAESRAVGELSEKSPTIFVMMLTPVALDPYCTMSGSAESGCGDWYRLFSGPTETDHFFSFRMAAIMVANDQQSEHASTNKTSTDEGGLTSVRLPLKASISNDLGRVSFCSASCAWAARAFASAVPFLSWSPCVDSSAIRSLASATRAVASDLYAASSLVASSASICWRRTTTAVATTTASAATAAKPSDTSMVVSHPCKSSPHIRLTLFEKTVWSTSALSISGILATMVWVLWRYRRDLRLKSPPMLLLRVPSLQYTLERTWQEMCCPRSGQPSSA